MLGTFTYNTPHLVYWDWRIAADLFLGGVGVGAFLWAVLNSLCHKDKYRTVSKVGAILAPIFVILGVLLMMTETGHPLRMLGIIGGFNVSSPLSWGAMFQGVMVGIAILYAFLWIISAPAKLRNLVGVVGIPVALVVGAFHGWLLSDMVARPLWNTGLTIVLAMISFVTTGMAAVLLVVCLLGKKTTGQDAEGLVSRGACRILTAALAAQVVAMIAWWVSLSKGTADAQDALATFSAAYGGVFWLVSIGLGLVVPLGLQVVAAAGRSKESAAINTPLAVLTSILILLGGLVFRYVLVIGGQLS